MFIDLLESVSINALMFYSIVTVFISVVIATVVTFSEAREQQRYEARVKRMNRYRY